MAYRAFFALPVDNFATSTGQHTNAVFGFTSMLINVLRDEQPTHVAVAFDVARESFRTEQYPEYKANRSASPAEFKGQVTLIKDVLEALNIVHLEKPGYEADDIIATLATQADQAGVKTFICTGDRDAMQLVSENVTVLYPRKGVSDLARMTPEAVEEKYLVPPARYPELAALVGETSDNLPGVPGVGPKTAAKWLTAYDGLDNLVARAEQVPGKAGESFRSHLDDVVRNRKLNALLRDLDLETTVDATLRQDWNRERVHELFDALEFRVLRDRLLELQPTEETPIEAYVVDGEVLEPDAVAAWLSEHGTGRTGLTFRGTWGAGTGDLAGIAFAAEDGALAYVDAARISPADDEALAAWLADETPTKVLHEAKGPTLACWARGWNLRGVAFDTLLAAYLLRPDQRTYDLADLVLRHLKRDLVAAKESDSDQLALDFGEDDQDAETAMLHAQAVLELAGVLNAELEERDEGSLMRDVELPLQRILAETERVGIAVDIERLEELRGEFDDAVQAAQQQAWGVIGHEVNLGSPKQLQAVLFDELGMPKTRRTKSGYTTDAEALEGLFAKTEHPFLAHLLAHRDHIRLRQTVDGLLASVQPDGRIHTTYVQTIAATGRLSSTDPNLQNIPIRTEDGRRIRRAFVAPAGRKLIACDYSQIELRIMAHLSGDPGLVGAFESGADVHRATAAEVFGRTIDTVSGDERRAAKAINFGLMYGMSAFGLARQLGIGRGEAQDYIALYFSRYPGVRDFMETTRQQARDKGYVETVFGRRLYLDFINAGSQGQRAGAERAAINAPMQGTAADIIKRAMVSVDGWIADHAQRALMILQVHDELVFEADADFVDTLLAEVTARMSAAASLRVPLVVDSGVGDNWDEAH